MSWSERSPAWPMISNLRLAGSRFYHPSNRGLEARIDGLDAEVAAGAQLVFLRLHRGAPVAEGVDQTARVPASTSMKSHSPPPLSTSREKGGFTPPGQP